MDLLKFLFGSGWMIAWHGALWLAAGILVILPIKMLADDALKVPVPTATLGTMGAMFMPVFYFLAATVINGALASRTMQGSWLTRAALVFAAATVACVVMSLAFAAMMQRPGRGSVVLVCLTAAGLMAGNLWLARIGVSRAEATVRIPRGPIVTVLLLVVGLPAAFLFFGFILALIRGDR
jgi:hypothetical protein